MPSFSELIPENLSASSWQTGNPNGGNPFAPRGLPVSDSADLQRILALPRRKVLVEGTMEAEAMIEYEMSKYGRPNDKCRCAEIDPQIAAGKRGCIKRLHALQAQALYELGTVGGFIGALFPGFGKTCLDVLGILALPQCKLGLLLAPPTLLEQLIRDYQLIREHFRVPGIVVHMSGKRDWSAVAEPGEPTLHVLPYSALSSEHASDWIDHLEPDIVIADECFPGDTLITTDEGDLRIDDIVNNGRGKYAVSWNKQTHKQEWKLITAGVKKVSSKRLVKVTHGKGTFSCTEDHRVWTDNRGYIEAKKLASYDRLRLCDLQENIQAEPMEQAFYLFEGVQERISKNTDRATQYQSLYSMRRALPERTLPKPRLLQQEVWKHKQTQKKQTVCNLLKGIYSKQICHQNVQCSMSQQMAIHKANSSNQTSTAESAEKLYRLREGISNQEQREEHNQAMFSQMWMDQSANRSQETCTLFTSENESVGIQCQPGSTCSGISKDERQNVSITGWKRETYQTAGGFVQSTAATCRNYGACYNGEGSQRSFPKSAKPLQSRCWNTGDQTSNRSGWKLSLNQEVEVSGSQEDRDSELSRVVSVEILEQRNRSGYRTSSEQDPVYDLTVADNHNYFANGVLVSNCDSIADMTSARTARLRRYYTGPDDMPKEQRMERLKRLHFAGWTGSLTDKSILEYIPATILALRENSPVPMDPQVGQEWALHLDASSQCPAGALMQLCQGDENARQGYCRRLTETAGFLITTESDVIVSGGTTAIENDISVRPSPEIPEIITKALAMVADFRRPDTLDGNDHDEWLDSPLQQAECAAQISTGMFYKYIFPNNEPDELKDEWFDARKDYFSEQREKKLRGDKYLDSNKLCQSAAMRAWGQLPPDPQRPEWKAESWPRWFAVKDKVKPKTKAVRLHPFLVDDAAQWGLENRGIIWYQMVEFGEWCAEKSGLKIYGGGSKDYHRLTAETGDKSIIVSIKSRGRGFDGLQHLFDHQLVANVPSSSKIWHQLLRRIIRRGQRSESTLTETYQHTPSFCKSLKQALARSEYVFESIGEKQTLLKGWTGER